MRNMRMWKRIAASALSGIILSIGVISSVSLAQGPSTDVWIDVVKGPSLARISVTVPMMYGFAVNGTTNLSDTAPITVADGTLLISNVKIEVTDPTSNHSDYTVQVEGVAQMPVRNYSTDVLEENLELTDPPRVGLAVRLHAAMSSPVNSLGQMITGQQAAYWQFVAESPTDQDADFKKYRVSLDGKAFNTEYTDEPDLIYLEDEIVLPVPPDLETNGYAASGFAYIPSVSYLPVTVEVGGKRNQYTQVEQSVKVGRIVWSAEAVDQTP